MRNLRQAFKFGITLVLCLATFSSWAADFPTRPITLLVGYPPGGPADLQARAIAKAAAPYLGQPIVVVSKPGATGTIMMNALAKAGNDGYTLGITPGSSLVAPYFMKVPYDIRKDFTYLAAISAFPEAFVVRSDSPWKTLPEMIAYARKNPNKLNVGVADTASSVMMLAKMVGEEAGVKWTPVPFTGDNAVVLALLSGTVQAAVCAAAHIPQVKAGKFRILANATQERTKLSPDVPTLKELGFNLSSFTLSGIVGPKGLPEPVAEKLEQAFDKARNDPDFQETLARMTLLPQFETGKKFQDRVVASYDLIGKFLKK